jgi:hypothetical protein
MVPQMPQRKDWMSKSPSRLALTYLIFNNAGFRNWELEPSRCTPQPKLTFVRGGDPILDCGVGMSDGESREG